jgi:TatD DNase family protein
MRDAETGACSFSGFDFNGQSQNPADSVPAFHFPFSIFHFPFSIVTTMEFYDTHLHLKPTDSAAAVFAAARACLVTRFVVVGADFESSAAAAELVSAGEPGVYATVGIHPHDAKAFAGDLSPFRRWLAQPGVVAVGEIGLDYYYHHSPREAQIPVFRQFLELALELDKPVVIHCREAVPDLLAVLAETWRPGHPFEVHSFTGTVPEVEQIIAMGGMVSFNGMVTFAKSENLRDLVRAVPLEQLLLETDAPYLTPEPFRKNRNEPKYIPVVAAKVAEVKGIDLAELALATCANARRFFRLPEVP